MTVPSDNNPKFNMAHNPVYQIDFSAVESGKRIVASKRRVRFRFGFSDPQAISDGKVGMECRGEEHEVTLVWSLTSGKRLVLADGHEVHFSKGSLQQTKFDTTWTMRGQHTIKLVAHATPPLFHTPGFRQFELFIDGMSFFQMPRIYELGRGSTGRGMVVRDSNSSMEAPSYNNYSLPPQQEAYYEEQVSAHERRRQLDRGYSSSVHTAPVSEEPSFARPNETRAESMPVDLMSDPTPVMEQQDHLAAPVPLLEGGVPTTHDEFAPVAPAPEAPPSIQNVHAEILTAYGGPPSKPALPALAMEPHTQGVPTPETNMVTPTSGQGGFFATNTPAPTQANNLVSPVSDLSTPSNFYSPPPPQQQYYQQPPHTAEQPPYYPPQPAVEQPPYYPQQQPPAPVEQVVAVQQVPPPQEQPKLTMMEYHQEAIPEEPEKVENALKSLVNLDDITQDPNTPEKQRLALLEKQKQEELATKRSKPVPPSHGAWHLGPSPSLNEVKETAQPRAPPQREVMKTHAFDPRAAQAGMMVVYGQQAPQMAMQQQHSQIGGFGFGAAVASRAY